MNTPLDAELDAARRAALAAGEMIRDEYERFVPIPNAPVSISTHVDRGSQDLILAALSKEFPDDAFLAEEDTPLLAGLRRAGPRQWVIDPIDGTRGFARKNGEFSVMIALMIDGSVAVGAVYEPVQRRLTFAAAGMGCFAHLDGGPPVRCVASTTADPRAATLTQSHSRPGRPISPAVAALAPARVLETYSAGVKLAQVARGEADIYVTAEVGFRDWDIAAGEILVTEAGGRMTTLRGEPIRYGREGYLQRSGLIAAGASLHPAAVAGLAGVQLKERGPAA